MGGSDPYLRYERKRFAEVLAAAIDYFVDDGVTKERVVDKVRKAFKHLADTGQIRPFVADAGSPGTVVPGVLFDFSGGGWGRS